MNLGLAVVVEGTRLQRRLKLPGALEELCLRGNLAHKHLPGDRLRALQRRQLRILKGDQLSTELEKDKNKQTSGVQGNKIFDTDLSTMTLKKNKHSLRMKRQLACVPTWGVSLEEE